MFRHGGVLPLLSDGDMNIQDVKTDTYGDVVMLIHLPTMISVHGKRETTKNDLYKKLWNELEKKVIKYK